MKLEDYIKENGYSNRYFAKIAKLDNSTITLLIQGKRKPRQDTLIKIFIATKGQVTADDFYHG
jgi:predicted transcriptional regulator